MVIFSDLMDDLWGQGINSLARRGFEISILHILSDDETNPDLVGDFLLSDLETNKKVEITADYETLDRYQRNLRTWQAGWQKFCAARNIRYIPVITSLPLEDLLFAKLRLQGVLK